MKQTTHYSRIEKIVLEFDLSDIQNALLDFAKFDRYKAGRRTELEMIDNDDDERTDSAILTIIFEKPDDK